MRARNPAHGGGHRPRRSGRSSRTATETLRADTVLLLTGCHADAEFLRRAGVVVDDQTLEPSYDAETFETNVRNLFIAGGQLAGRRMGAGFIENGRFHGERIARVLAGRFQQAF